MPAPIKTTAQDNECSNEAAIALLISFRDKVDEIIEAASQ